MTTSFPAPVIFGLAGTVLSAAEQAFFTKTQPAGFILFSRNIETKEQVAALVHSLKECVQHTPVAILIDQEGGRVMRLKPPVWSPRKPAGFFAALWQENPEQALQACYEENRAIALDLQELGITVNCTPVLDVPVSGSHEIISDRAFGTTADSIIPLAQAAATAHLDAGIMPIIKHIPGHGRATADSHLELPIVDAAENVLYNTDFQPFIALSALPWAMTAHIVYSAIDATLPATLSAPLIQQVIRKQIGFNGVLISDDLNMKALHGNIAENAAACLAAGCDLALHCSGDLQEMRDIAATLPAMRPTSWQRYEKGFHALQQGLAA